jgi:hypothetical protein
MSPDDIRRRLAEVPDIRTSPALVHDALIQIGNHILDLAAAEHRDLSLWETDCVAGAISALAARWLAVAFADLKLAMANPATISPSAVSPEHAASLDSIDVAQMRRALAFLAGERPWERLWHQRS